MMLSENRIRRWISSAGTTPGRYLRFFSLPVIILASFSILFFAGFSAMDRFEKSRGQSLVQISISITSPLKQKGCRISG